MDHLSKSQGSIARQGKPLAISEDVPADVPATSSAEKCGRLTTIDSRNSQWRNRFIPARLFRGLVWVIWWPVALADAGDDFTNNLFSDLAPILALFGERVAQQFMRQSMGFADDIIFATAPLGIITAMVGAIRVGGYPWLKALIGRATEGRGEVEVELMSSTSGNVCELWGGNGVVRVPGSPEIIEVYYAGHNPGSSIYSFKEAKAKSILWSSTASHEKRFSDAGPEERMLSQEPAPNITLNLAKRTSRRELIVVAVIGTLLQLGVIAFAGLSVHLSPWNERFKKNDRPVGSYAFPMMAVGTVALMLGMFMCAHIIERSTEEGTWKINRKNMKVSWLQRGVTVGDQQFDSYLIKRPERLDSSVITSHSGGEMHQELYVAVAIFISLSGFVTQFVALRNLNWSVTIAQLVATGIMTTLRAFVRRNLVHDSSGHTKIARGYELDTMARDINNCTAWNIVTLCHHRSTINPLSNFTVHGNTSRSHIHDTPEDTGSTKRANGELAQRVMESRQRLSQLAGWKSEREKTVDSTVKAIEVAMNFLFSENTVIINREYSTGEEFEWELLVEVSNGGANSFESLRITMNRQRILETPRSSPWKVAKTDIEAVIGLWMLHFHEQKSVKCSSTADSHNKVSYYDPNICYVRPIGIDGSLTGNLSRRWIRKAEDPVTEDPVDPAPATVSNGGEAADGKSIIRYISTDRLLTGEDEIRWIPQQTPYIRLCSEERDDLPELLVVPCELPLERACGQVVFSEFFSQLVEKCVDRVEASVLIRDGNTGAKQSFGLRSDLFDQLVTRLVSTELFDIHEGYTSIVPAFSGSEKLPTGPDSSELFARTVQTAKEYNQVGRFEQADCNLTYLFDSVESFTKSKRTLLKEDEFKTYLDIYCQLYDACNTLECKHYAMQAKEELCLFCELPMFSWEVNYSQILLAIRETLEPRTDPLWRRIVQRAKENLELSEEQRRAISIPTKQHTITLAAYAGNCLLVTKLLAGSDENAVNSVDERGQTALMIAANEGYATVTRALLEGNADPHIKDVNNRTALHYASMKGHAAVARTLLCHREVEKFIHAKDRDDKTGLDLAIENHSGALAALLTFYGGLSHEASYLLQLSVDFGFFKLENTDLERRDAVYGRTPLHWSVWRGNLEVSKLVCTRRSEIVDVTDRDGYTALHLAAVNGQSFIIRFLINDAKARTTILTDADSTPLHLAASCGHVSSVQLLLEQEGVEVNCKDKYEQTPFSYAARKGHEKVVQLLLERQDVEVNCKDKYEQTPLSWAVRMGHEKVAQLLLKRQDVEAGSKARNGWTPLSWAARNGLVRVFQLLLERPDVKADSKTQDGQTPLSLAAGEGHEKVVQLLLERQDVDVNCKDKYEQTPLSCAARMGHEKVVQLLLERQDVEADSMGGDERTPLSLAAGEGHEKVVQLLLERQDVDVNCKDKYEQTPLSCAARMGHEKVVQLLLERQDVEADSMGGDERTPLSWAAANGHEMVVQLLLGRQDVKADAKDVIHGQTPLSLAATNGHVRVVQLLLERPDVKADSKTQDGQTPLSLAAGEGHKKVVQLLLERQDVEVNSKDILFERTPLSWAAKNGHEKVVQLLLERQDVEVNSKESPFQRTPLSLAARMGHEKVVQLLLERHDVEADSMGGDGRTPLSWAAANGHEMVVQLLLERQDVEADPKVISGRTPLSWAAANGHEKVVQLLLERQDVEVNSKDILFERTPLSWAAKNGHERVVQLLLKRPDVQRDSRDRHRLTALTLATENGHRRVERLLEC